MKLVFLIGNIGRRLTGVSTNVFGFQVAGETIPLYFDGGLHKPPVLRHDTSSHGIHEAEEVARVVGEDATRRKCTSNVGTDFLILREGREITRVRTTTCTGHGSVSNRQNWNLTWTWSMKDIHRTIKEKEVVVSSVIPLKETAGWVVRALSYPITKACYE